MALYIQMAIDSVEVAALYIHVGLCFPSGFAVSFCGFRVRRPGMRFEPYFLCVVTPFCIYTCLLIRLGLRFCIDKWLLIRLELWRCIYTVTWAFRPVRFEVLRAQGSDCVATPACDSSATPILRGGWDNAAGVSGSDGVGCAISLDRVERWKRGRKWEGWFGDPHPCEAVMNGAPGACVASFR